MKQNLMNLMKHYNVVGLGVAFIENGEISSTESIGVLETGTNEMVNNNTIFNASSISKFVTSVLVMKLIELKMLDLDEDINTKLTSWKVPENEFTKNKKVTLRTLLSHQPGFIDPDGSFPEITSNDNSPSMTELLTGNTPYYKEAIEVKYEPGSEFHYSDAGFCIIQQLIEDVTKLPFHEVMTELVFNPLQMKNSTYDITNSKNKSSGHHKNGDIVNSKYPIYPYPAASGLWSTPSEIAALVMEIIRSLHGKSKIDLSSRLTKEMIQSQGKQWTGLGLFLDKSGVEIEISSLGWGVGFQCMMIAFPYLEKGFVIMTNSDLGVHQLEGIIGEVYKDYVS